LSQALASLKNQKLLLVASTGGHLSQLKRLADRIAPSDDSLWVTFDKPQSTSMLKDKRHLFVPYIAPRDFSGVAREMRTFNRILKSEEFDAVVSTGAALALASHVPSSMRKVRTIYIESVSRFDGPSMTGRLLQRSRRIERYSQHPGYDERRWTHEFSVLDTYSSDIVPASSTPPASIFVTLGTIHPYRFDRLVDRLVQAAPPGTEFTWQLGVTGRSDLPGKVTAEMSSAEFESAIASADLVVTHAGVGTIMGLLDAGKPTLVVPRRKSKNEHVDDHQLQITRQLQERSLLFTSEADDVSVDSLIEAMRYRPQI